LVALRAVHRDKRKNSTTVMSKEHWHVGSRPDYITHLALSRSHAEHRGHVPSRPKHDAHMPKHLQLQPSVIPDLRFEPTYLAKLAAAGPGWKSVVWVTVRDQMISPLLQGTLWCVACRRRSWPLFDIACTGVLHPSLYSLYYGPSPGSGPSLTVYGPRRKAAQQVGFANGPARFSRMRGQGIHQGLDDEKLRVGAS